MTKVLALIDGKLTEIYISSGLNFSYKKIITGQTIEIPENQQMIVVDGIEIEGSLEVSGELCLM